jgi:hypothetical protein
MTFLGGVCTAEVTLYVEYVQADRAYPLVVGSPAQGVLVRGCRSPIFYCGTRYLLYVWNLMKKIEEHVASIVEYGS